MLDIDVGKVCYIIFKSRELFAKEAPVEEDYASDPADEDMREVLEDFGDDPVYEELEGFIDSLSEDEQIRLVALAWVGRGDFSPDEWEEALAEATRAREESDSTARYLLGMPLLPEYLAEGLAGFGRSCDEGEEPQVPVEEA